MLLAAITTIFLAAEKQWTLLDWKPKKPDMLVDTFGFGRIIQDGMNFMIRSYEIGADRTASIETLMNHLQETALNHVRTAGLLGDGFGATPEMSKRNLIWVIWFKLTHGSLLLAKMACVETGMFVTTTLAEQS
uniref:Acyl-[acyl-carrier-protein] hydrolase n=1 Tax=Oryza rufipogon TaxID=4529 RepID=A0A0E0NIF0_ORYRU